MDKNVETKLKELESKIENLEKENKDFKENQPKEINFESEDFKKAVKENIPNVDFESEDFKKAIASNLSDEIKSKISIQMKEEVKTLKDDLEVTFKKVEEKNPEENQDEFEKEFEKELSQVRKR